MSNQNLNLVVTTDASGAITGLAGLNSNISNLKDQANSASDAMGNGFSTAAKGVQSISTQLQAPKTQLVGLALANLGIESFKSLINAADHVQQLDDRLKMVTHSTAEFASAKSALIAISARQTSDLSESIGLYTGLARATQDSGISQTQLLKVTESVSAGLRISGASTAEAASAMQQLKQAMASGRLAGEEFNSMSESAPILLDVLASSLGVARSELKGMAADGEITTDVMVKAFAEANKDLVAQSSQISATVSASYGVMTAAMAQEWAKLNQKMGLNSGISSVLQKVGDSLQGIGKHADVAVSALASVAAMAAARAVPALATMAIGAMQAASALNIATLASKAFQLAGGWIGIIAMVTAAAASWLLFRDNAVEAAEKGRSALEDYGTSIDEVKTKIEGLSQAERALKISQISEQITKERAVIEEEMAKIATSITTMNVGAATKIASGQGYNGIAHEINSEFAPALALAKQKIEELSQALASGKITNDQFDTELKALVSSNKTFGDGLNTSIVAVQQSSQALKLQAAQTQALQGNYAPLNAIIKEHENAQNNTAKATQGLSKEQQKQAEKLSDYLDKLRESVTTMGMSAAQLAQYTAKQMGASEAQSQYAADVARSKEILEDYQRAYASGKEEEITKAKAAFVANQVYLEGQKQASTVVSSAAGFLDSLKISYKDVTSAAYDAAKGVVTFKNANLGMQTGNRPGPFKDNLTGGSDYGQLWEDQNKSKGNIEGSTDVKAPKTGKSKTSGSGASHASTMKDINELIAAKKKEADAQLALNIATAAGDEALQAYNINKELEAELAKSNKKYSKEQIETLKEEIIQRHKASASAAEFSKITDILDKNKSAQEKVNETLAQYQKMMDKIAKGDYAKELEAHGISAEEAIQGIQKEIENTPAIMDESATLMENSLKRLDDGFASMWKGLLDGSKSAFDGFKDIAISTLAEIIHQYTTKQIVANLGAMFQSGGGSAAAGVAGSAGGGSVGSSVSGIAGIGSSIGSLFGAGGAAAGSAMGASFAAGMAAPVETLTTAFSGGIAAAGGFMAIAGAALPILGAIGLAASFLFKKKPSDMTAAGKMNLGSAHSQDAFESTSLQGKKYSKENNDARDAIMHAVYQVKEGIVKGFGASFNADMIVEVGNRDGLRLTVNGKKQVFETIEDLMQGAIVAVVDNAQGMDERIKAMAHTQADGLDAQGLMVYLSSLEQFNNLVKDASQTMADSAYKVATSLDAQGLAHYAAGLNVISEFMKYDLSADYAKKMADANKSLTMQYLEQSQKVSELSSHFDFSTQSVDELALSLANMGDLALAMVAGISDAQAQMQTTIASSIEQIQMSVMDNAQKYDYLKGNAEAEFQKAIEGNDWQEIQKAFEAANNYALQAYNTMDDQGKKDHNQEYIDWLNALQEQANAKLEAAKQGTIADVTKRQDELGAVVNGDDAVHEKDLRTAGVSLDEAGNKLSAAADKLMGNESAQAFEKDSSTNVAALVQSAIQIQNQDLAQALSAANMQVLDKSSTDIDKLVASFSSANPQDLAQALSLANRQVLDKSSTDIDKLVASFSSANPQDLAQTLSAANMQVLDKSSTDIDKLVASFSSANPQDLAQALSAANMQVLDKSSTDIDKLVASFSSANPQDLAQALSADVFSKMGELSAKSDEETQNLIMALISDQSLNADASFNVDDVIHALNLAIPDFTPIVTQNKETAQTMADSAGGMLEKVGNCASNAIESAINKAAEALSAAARLIPKDFNVNVAVAYPASSQTGGR